MKIQKNGFPYYVKSISDGGIVYAYGVFYEDENGEHQKSLCYVNLNGDWQHARAQARSSRKFFNEEWSNKVTATNFANVSGAFGKFVRCDE